MMKSEVIRARINKETFDALQEEMKEKGYASLSELLRYKLEQDVALEPMHLTPMLEGIIGTRKEVIALGRNLNQIARNLNRFEPVKAQELSTQYTELNRVFFELKCKLEDVLDALNQTRR